MSNVKPEHIPDEALAAFAAATIMGKGYSECIAAALNAWPKSVHDVPGHRKTYILPAIILPLGDSNEQP